jgi:hypothetical protein
MDVIKKDADCIQWDVQPRLIDAGENGMLVEMQWGWDAWATPEELANRGDDVPSGFDGVVMNIEQARELRDQLTAIVESSEAAVVTEEHAAILKRIDELSARHDDQLRDAFPGPAHERRNDAPLTPRQNPPTAILRVQRTSHSQRHTTP